MVAYEVTNFMPRSPFSVGRLDILNSSRNHWESLCGLFTSLRDYSFGRRDAGLLGMKEYASDIRRFKHVLSRLASASAHAAQRPLLIWKYSTPQHFPTPSGMWKWEGMPSQPWKVGNFGFEFDNCRPIQKPMKAYARNTIAEHILESLFADGILILMSQSWHNLIKYHDLHLANGDCTHWCLNSVVPRFWAQDLLSVVKRHTQGCTWSGCRRNHTNTSNGSSRTITNTSNGSSRTNDSNYTSKRFTRHIFKRHFDLV
eukprot:gnl/TRDRNA2_/TRDRNA2_168561_c1_seq1.p1 gnl/TRDRNA2_/TRDRNA2_168561_c1~~gnl/TRDRNA2_/TRDRNA2_168561_c1_seq1.p1  ORF type:complete len:294 (+),score=-8.62 gnl/TRDRNA2_/TRDRNA2_168561_c1_seq1:114-884(+)